MLEPARIVIRCPNWVGDLVMATPSLRAVRERYPRAHIAWALRPHLQAVVRGNPCFDELIAVPRVRGLKGLVQAARAYRPGRFQLALILPNSWDSALGPFLARIPERIGYARDGRSPLLSRRLVPPRLGGKRIPRPMVHHYADLAGTLDAHVRATRPELYHEPEDERRWHGRMSALGADPRRPYAVLNPGAAYGSSKMWTVAGFAAVANHLEVSHGLQTFISVGPGEESLAREIAEHAPGAIPVVDPILDLHDLKATVAGAEILVTTDTGTRQYASAHGIKTVVIFGPTDERFTADGLERSRLVREPLACAPCHKKSCPLEDHQCMSGLAPERVIDAVNALLEEVA